MYSFTINDPNVGFGQVLNALFDEGVVSDSRNGPVSRFPKPVCLEYPNPRRRLLDHPIRDGNHFFHLMETMWMFAGLDTVQPLDVFNEQFKQYSDDGVTFAAPYGYRWRYHFGFDQIVTAVQKLKANPEDRRIVIQMWDPQELRKESGKDFACNQQILLDTRPDKGCTGDYLLDMTVTNRSNDLVYGAMGSNLFHMSMLHEYIALHAGLALGTYYQISKNMHLYRENEVSKRCWERRSEFTEPSDKGDISLTDLGLPLEPLPIADYVNSHYLSHGNRVREDYLVQVVHPICHAYRIYKMKYLTGIETPLEVRVELALETLEACQSDALRNACRDWLRRRLENKRAKAA